MQGGRKRTEVAKIGKEPVSQRENAIEDCLNELLEMAKTIGKEQLLLGKDSEVERNTIPVKEEEIHIYLLAAWTIHTLIS